MKKIMLGLGIGAVCLFALGCTKDGSAAAGYSITQIEPAVEAAAGPGLTSAHISSVQRTALSSTSFRDRFFSSGPTDILRILTALDTRLAGIAAQITPPADGQDFVNHECLNNTPVSLPLSVYGDTFTLYMQCYEDIIGGGVIGFGFKTDTWYVFEKQGDGFIAASAKTLTSGKLQVEIYGGIGLGSSPWSVGSYGGYHVTANTETNSLEMTAAGIGVGYCGVQVKSDGTNIFFTGSEDGGGCGALASTCVLSSNLTDPGTCTNVDATNFTLRPIGRNSGTYASMGSFAASLYPVTPNITLNGTGSDSIHVGPSVGTDFPVGVTAF